MTLPSPTDLVAAGMTGGLWGWVALSGLAITSSVILLVFIYLFATLTKNASLNAYVKQEFYEVIITCMLIIFLFMGVGSMLNLKLGMFLPSELLPSNVGPSTNIYDATGYYFDRVDTDMSGWLSENYWVNMYVDQSASITPYARPLGVGLVASPMAGFAAPIKQLLYNMCMALTIAYIINYAQYVVYLFSLRAFLSFYLPLGIFLRAFTPTRRIGGTLIGVSIAFLFVFPILYSITYAIFYNPAAGPLLTFSSLSTNYFTESTGGFQDVMGGLYLNNGSDIGSSVISIISGAFGGIGTVFTNLLGSFMLGILIFPIASVSIAFAVGFVMPAFNILLFTQTARSLSKVLGEEVDVSSLTRMI